MSRARCLLGVLLFQGIVSAPGSWGAADTRPNVVLIVADDLGGADLACYGSRFHHTPSLDRLAASGRRFTQAYAACPVCSPTRAAIMTGKYPARLHLTDWLPGRPDRPDQKLRRPALRQELPLDEVTLAEVLKGAGYATAHMGKWHLGGLGFEPTRQGFDLNIGGDDRGHPPSYFAPFGGKGRALPGLGDAPEGQYLTDRLTTEAESFIASHRSAPFFLYLPHFAVHTPIQGKTDLVGHYATWDGTPHGRQENPTYAAMLDSLDESVGRVVAAIEKAGIADRTVVIFTSDNGGLATREGPLTPATNNAPFREGKGWLYEGGIRVPLIVRWSGHVQPGVDATPAWSGDLLPTVLGLCGVVDPVRRDGENLASLLTGGTPLSPRALYWHYPHYSNQGGRPGGAVRVPGFKLIEDYETGRRELYDVRDVSETNNLAAMLPSKVDELAAQLAAWRKAVGAEMPTPNPDYRPDTQAETGVVVLHARTAEVHGSALRYEPLPHKNTLGFWTRADDWASWEFDLVRPGVFAVEALVGCGAGSGGSTVEFRIDGQVLTLFVPVTGGFQTFVPQPLGRVMLDRPGRHRLEVRATAKPGPAVMDLREVRLTPAR
jgi:arylsulfatase A